MELKIGVLLARSDMFPKLAMDFLNGLKGAFKNSDNEPIHPKLLIESIGNATDDDLLRQIEKMILQEDADVIVTFCSYFMLDKLVAIANSYKKPIIHVSLGARVLKNTHVSPYVLYQSLNLSHSSYLSGKAAATLGKKGALLSSFYDGGYHTAEAFVRGFTDFGGEMVYSYVSQMDYKEDDFRSMVEGVNNAQPEVLFALFSYKEAARVLDVIAESELNRLQTMALPLMVDESTIVNDIHPDTIQSIASWAFESGSKEMESFAIHYKQHYAENPNIFSVLGNEVGTVITNALHNEGRVPQDIGSYMRSKTILSPRGELRYTEHQESIPKVFKVRQLSVQKGTCHNLVTAEIDSAASEIIYEKMENSPATGWRNPYICT